MTEEGKARLKEGCIEGAYLGPDGRVHIPGKRVTLYSEPSPPLEELQQQVIPTHTHMLSDQSGAKVIVGCMHCFSCRLVVPLRALTGAVQTLTMT